MYKAAFFTNSPSQIDRVYGEGRKERLASALEFYPDIVGSVNFEASLPRLQELQFIFSVWGMPELTVEQIKRLPALKVLFYAAGSVQYFARPFLQSGVQVVSAWAANGVPVAQFTVAQIFLAAKGYFTAARLCRTAQGREQFSSPYAGLYGATISLLGAGMIGKKVIELLRPHGLEILVFDPYLSEAMAEELGVKKVSLEEAFKRGVVVSNHLANLPATVGMLRRDLFESMRPYAAFINTGRGATVDEAGMLAVLEKRPDLTALLDVTEPEPPSPDSPIYRLGNVLLSPHIAGSIGREVLRQADCVTEEFERYQRGEKMLYGVTLEMLETMA